MDPLSSLTETKSSRKESSFLAKMSLIKSVGAGNRRSPAILRKFVPLYHRNTKIRMLSHECDLVIFGIIIIIQSCNYTHVYSYI